MMADKEQEIRNKIDKAIKRGFLKLEHLLLKEIASRNLLKTESATLLRMELYQALSTAWRAYETKSLKQGEDIDDEQDLIFDAFKLFYKNNLEGKLKHSSIDEIIAELEEWFNERDHGLPWAAAVVCGHCGQQSYLGRNLRICARHGNRCQEDDCAEEEDSGPGYYHP